MLKTQFSKSYVEAKLHVGKVKYGYEDIFFYFFILRSAYNVALVRYTYNTLQDAPGWLKGVQRNIEALYATCRHVFDVVQVICYQVNKVCMRTMSTSSPVTVVVR